MSIDWKIVINCDISIHGISNIAEINLYVTNIEECLFSIVGGGRGKTFLKMSRRICSKLFILVVSGNWKGHLFNFLSPGIEKDNFPVFYICLNYLTSHKYSFFIL